MLNKDEEEQTQYMLERVMKNALDGLEAYSQSMKRITKDKMSDGIYIIDSGKCRVVNPSDGREFKMLLKSDFFGESEFLKVVDYAQFGDIVAVSDVTCIFIPRECLHRIQFHELNKLRDHCLKRAEIERLSSKVASIYNLRQRDLLNFI